MYLLYADESGDKGLIGNQSPTKYFILSSFILEDKNWHNILSSFINFRREIKRIYGYPIKKEIHASELIRHKGSAYEHLKTPQQGIEIYLNHLKFLGSLNVLNVKTISVLILKEFCKENINIFDTAWTFLMQRFHNYLKFSGESKGIIFSDVTDGKTLSKLQRKLRRYNPVPDKFKNKPYNDPMMTIIEDPVLKNSVESYFIQAADSIAYSISQLVFPNKFIRRYKLKEAYFYLENLFMKEACNNNLGIVIYPPNKDKELITLKKEKPFLKEGHTLAGPTSPFGGSDPQ